MKKAKYVKLILTISLAFALALPALQTTQAQPATGTTQYPWPMMYGNYLRDGVQAGPGPTTGHLLWKAGPMSGLPAWGTAVADGKVFQGVYDYGDVYAYDQNTGELIWQQHLNHTSYGVMYYNGNIYTAGMSYDPHDFTAVTGNEWVCLDAETGSIKWIWKIPPTINGIPQNLTIYVGNFLIVRPSQPTVYRDKLWISINGGYALLNPETGAVLTYLTTGDIDTFPAFDGDYHYGIANGTVYSINVDTLEVGWRSSRLRYGGSHVTISGGFLYVTTGDGNITRLAQKDGVMVWEMPWTARTRTLPTATISLLGPPPCVAYKRLLFGSIEGAIYSVDCATDNTAQWAFQTGGAIYAHSAVADGKFYTGSSDGSVYCLTVTGDLVWKYDIGYQISGSPAIADGKLYIMGDDKYMYCFGPGPASAIALNAPTTLTTGQNLPINGRFTDASGNGIANEAVTLRYRLEPMTQPRDIATATTASDGSYSYTWTPPFDGYYEISASYQEPSMGGYSSSNSTLDVRVAPTAAQLELPEGVANTINSLQTLQIVIAVLVIVAIALSAVAVIYSRKKLKQ